MLIFVYGFHPISCQSMIQCNYCHAQNTGKFRFCYKCGNPLGLTTPSEDYTEVGNHNPPNPSNQDAYTPPESIPVSNPQFPQHKQRLSKATMVIGAVAFIVFGTGAFLLFKRVFTGKGENSAYAYDSSRYDTSTANAQQGAQEPETFNSNTYPDTTSSSSISSQNDAVEPYTEKTADGAATNDYDPQEDVFNFISENIWEGDMVSTNKEWSAHVKLRSNGNKRIILVLESVPCTSELTFNSFKLLSNNDYFFVFNERIIENSDKCTAGLASITASPSQPHKLQLKFYDLEYNLIAEGYFDRL